MSDVASASYIPLPQPSEVTQRERDDALGAYLMMFAALGVGLPLPVLNLIAALIYYYVNRATSRFVGFHALQSLLGQTPVTLANTFVVVWLIRIVLTDLEFPSEFYIALVVMGLLNVIYIVFSVIALSYARKGRMYYMPLFGRAAYSVHYRIKHESSAGYTNQPPEGF